MRDVATLKTKCDKCKNLLNLENVKLINTYIHCNNCNTYYKFQVDNVEVTDSDLVAFKLYFWLEERTKQEVFEKLLENSGNSDDYLNYTLLES